MRGNHNVSGDKGEASGSIPACAGEPLVPVRRYQALEVYPRVCGGTWMSAIAETRAVGLSPRVRGNHFAYRLHLV